MVDPKHVISTKPTRFSMYFLREFPFFKRILFDVYFFLWQKKYYFLFIFIKVWHRVARFFTKLVTRIVFRPLFCGIFAIFPIGVFLILAQVDNKTFWFSLRPNCSLNEPVLLLANWIKFFLAINSSNGRGVFDYERRDIFFRR